MRLREGSYSAIALATVMLGLIVAPPNSKAQVGSLPSANAGLSQNLPPYVPQSNPMVGPPTAGFAGLTSASGINPQSLPTTQADPRMQSMLGMVPKFSPDFLQRMQTGTLPAGTVLTGILENDLSSKKSKAGDVFSIRLEDGFSINGTEVIPKQSKILGSVSTAVASHSRKAGHPGSLTIALQTLIFPDGRTTQFWGFIEHNPLRNSRNQSGSNISSKASGYGKMASFGTLNFITRKVGYNLRPANYFGQELKLDKGEVLPIRSNRPIDLTKMNAPIQTMPMPPGTVNGVSQSGALPPGMSSISPNSAPGLPPYTPVTNNYIAPANSVPGLPPGYNLQPTPIMPATASQALGQLSPSAQSPNVLYPSQMEPF